MKNLFQIYFIFAMCSILNAQNEETTKHFGTTINTSISSAGVFLFIPSITYYKNKSQFELGAGSQFFLSYNVRNVFGTEFNYRYFVNGIDNRFNLYFITNLTYAQYKNNKTYSYTRKSSYLILTGGYGFQFNLFKRAYIGTCLNLGIQTFKNDYSPDFYNYNSPDLFRNFQTGAAIRMNVGYRFTKNKS